MNAAQVIPQIDPVEIGIAFHPSTIVPTYGAGRAGAEIAEKGNFRMETNWNLDQLIRV